MESSTQLREPCLASAVGRETRALAPLVSEWRIRCVTTGMGGRRSRAFLLKELAERPPSFLIFTGAAGALSPQVSLGQVILPESWALEDGRRFSGSVLLREKLQEIPNLLSPGLGLTVNRPVLRPRTRTRLHRETGALICDMEAAHALEAARIRQVPALALKVVSDTAESNLLDFWRQLDRNLELLRGQLNLVLEKLEVSRC